MKHSNGFDQSPAQARLKAEAARVARIKAEAAPPAEMAAAPAAPARGAMRLIHEVGFIPGSNERTRITGQFWRDACVLEVICRDAAARHAASGSDAGFVTPFTPGQIAMARRYRDMVERHTGGIKGASVEARPDGGAGDGGGFMDAYLHEGREIDALHRKIGAGFALELRRIRPSQRGARVAISDRALVDMVCLAGKSLGEVLIRHKWASNGRHRDKLQAALVVVLDRMQGYR